MGANLSPTRTRSTLNRGRIGMATSLTNRMTPGERARAVKDAASAFRSREL